MLKDLNKEQRDAVIYNDGPSLIVAGAGSGKTRVLTYKIAHLIEQGIPPYRILALTFTNKAADEMKHRIDSLLGFQVSKQLWMGTFHSICNKILRREGESLGFKSNFSVYDTLDSKRTVSALIDELNLNKDFYKAPQIYSRISKAKNNLITPEAYSQNAELMEDDKIRSTERFAELYLKYCRNLKNSQAMDFDDLLVWVNVLFKKHKAILEKYQNRFDFVLVDEYQDTNFAQYLIIKQIVDKHRKICVVGDDAQSIYGFRGALISNILNFKDDYPDYKLFKLEQNYRSTQNIIEAAGSVIKKNKNQIHKNLFSKNPKGPKVAVKNLISSSVEGYYVAEIIKNNVNHSNAKYTDFAVLYRTNAQSRIIEEALRKYDINYKVFGGLSFYQRKEIKDSIAYLRLINNNSDAESLRRIINYPARKIGNVTINKIFLFSENANIPLWEIIRNPENYNLGINAGTISKIKNFSELIADFTEKSKKNNAYELAKELFDKTGLVKELMAEDERENKHRGLGRFENFQEFLTGIKEFCENRKAEFPDVEAKISDYLENIALITDLDEKTDEVNFVSLMTIHSAKGLEFKNIFIVGAEERLIPSPMSSFSQEEIEEERRLFYVAMTRAKHNLIITHCNHRNIFGKTENALPSRFIEDIDPVFVDWEKYQESSCEFDDERNKYSDIQHNNVRRFSYNNDKKTPKTERKRHHTPKNLVSLNKIKNSGTHNPGNIKDIVPGVNVEHASFGTGKVLSLIEDGDDTKAVIFFNNEGNKTLLLKYAKLKIL